MSKKDKPSFDYEAELFTLRRGLSEGTIKDHHEVVPHKQRVSNYKWKYQKGVQIINGKPVPWDKRTNKPYDEKVAAKYVEAENKKLYDKFHLKYYKTTTPEKDLTYVEAYKDLEDYKRSRYRKVYNHIRRGFSPQIIGKDGEETGVTLYDRNLQLDLKRREEELLKLKSGTKYEREELKNLRNRFKEPETKQP